MLREQAYRLVEDDLRQNSSIDIGEKLLAILKMCRSIGTAWR